MRGFADTGKGAGIALNGAGVVFVGGGFDAGVESTRSDLLIAALEVETGKVRRFE